MFRKTKFKNLLLTFERIELVFNNKSNMAHPMHFHGHVFQVTEIKW